MESRSAATSRSSMPSQRSLPSRSIATRLESPYSMCLCETKSSALPATMRLPPICASCHLMELLVPVVSASKPLVLVAPEVLKGVALPLKHQRECQRLFLPYPLLDRPLFWTASQFSTRRTVRRCTPPCQSRFSSTGPMSFCLKSSKRGMMTPTSAGSRPSWMPGSTKTFVSPQRAKLLLGPTGSFPPTAILMA
jgi:hypothetical protein